MEAEKQYISEAQRCREKLMELMEILPPYCSLYFMAANQTLLPKTRLEYAKDLKTFFTYLKQKNPLYKEKDIKDIPIDVLEKLDSTDIDEYLMWLEYYDLGDKRITNGNTGKARKLASLKSFYKFLCKRGKLKNNPVSLVDTPDTKQRDHQILIFTTEEREALLNYIENGGPQMSKKEKEIHEKTKLRDYAIFMTFFGTGVRISELTGIDLEDIDFEYNSVIVHRKGGYNDIIYFGEEVRTALLAYIENGRDILHPPENEKACFISRKGTRFTSRGIELRLKDYADAVFGINNKFTPHKCRSTFGTQLYEETGDIYLVADVLGHKDVNTTRKHYAKMSEERKKRAATMSIRH